jgi:hypothetical protein
MHNLEAIWKDYDQFENNLSKILAKALLTEQSPKYMGARVVYRERKLLMEGILRNMLARSPRGMFSLFILCALSSIPCRLRISLLALLIKRANALVTSACVPRPLLM